MILFIAPFPDPAQGDGWMARIMAVDDIFKDRPRAYVYDKFAYKNTRPKGYEIFHKRHDALREEYVLNYSFNRHIRMLIELVEKADFVYAHTAHSARFMFSYYPTGKIVTDLHGLASLEEEMMGCPERAIFFKALEEPMIRGSAALVTVTKAMEEYYKSLYPNLETPFILNPIRQVLPECSESELRRETKEKPVVIFAGGAQEWQQPKKMLEVAQQLAGQYTFEFYTGWESVFKRMMLEMGMPDNAIHLSFCPREQLDQKYKQSDFGFALRSDSPVNRVACPTKLMEYMAFGVIPIVELYEIGDFASYGYHAVRLEDFIKGSLPDMSTLNRMRLENARICHAMNACCDTGISTLQFLKSIPAALDMRANAARFLPTLDRMYLATEAGVFYWTCDEKQGEQSGFLRDIPFGCGKFSFSLPEEGTLTSLRVFLMEPPFAVTPVHAQVETSNGTLHEISLKKTYRTDSLGNYFFEKDGFFHLALEKSIRNARHIHLSFTLLLSKGEVYLNSRPSQGYDMLNLKECIQKYVDVRNAKLLEIGAYDRPTFTKQEADIYFVDAQSKEELLADARKNGRYTEAIVDIDYIIHSNEYEKCIHDKFDVIIADNVFEHISNPIRWLRTLSALLHDNAYAFLCIPEYTAIFDKFRAPTTFAHILTDYIRNVPDLDPEHGIEIGIYYDMGYIREENKIHEKINLERSLNDYKNPHYGMHCHTFSYKTFINKIMKPILMLGVVDFKILECSTNHNGGAFIVALQKGREEVALTFDEFVAD
jgi:glycosyltransferase involved in cell wall biosynthesis